MKKLFYGITGLLLISIFSTYLFIPDKILVSEVEQVESSERIISRYVTNSTERAKWWTKTKPETALMTSGFQYDFHRAGYNSSEVLISGKHFKNNSSITWTPYADNIVEIRWKTSLTTSLNPVRRLLQYIEARRIKSDMALIIERLLTFIINSKNVYSLDIDQQTVKDTILATSTRISPDYPETTEVYQLINSVKSFVKKQNAEQVNYPMLNISKSSEGRYRTMVALPINKVIKPDQDFLINRMIPGNILVAQVKGGPGTIKTAFNQIELYMDDFNLLAPAIPFESLITDRNAESDTMKWITKIYYPVY
jgi:hypothetical protein